MNLQFICKNDVFDELNRVIIINNYKIDCEQFQINSSFYEEHNLWDYSAENVTWILEDRKLLLSPDELDRAFDASEAFTIGFEFSEDLDNKTGFSWCAGTMKKPQGIYWADGEGFVLVDGSSRTDKFDFKRKF